MNMVAEMMEKVVTGDMDFGSLERMTWEESLKQGRIAISNMLHAADDALFEKRPDGFKVVGKRERRMITLLGEITINRRYYKDGEGRYRFLLDEILDLDGSRSRLSPEVTEVATRTCAHIPYRVSADFLSFMLPTSLSHTTLMNCIREIGTDYREEQERGAEALFSFGELPPSEGREAATLYTELDATHINLQREKRKKGELKLAITHEGWEERGDGEYSLKEKRVHAGVSPSSEFIKTHIYDLSTHWSLAGVRFVVGGDGAPLAKKAAEMAPSSVFQLDRFHLKRAIMRGLSGNPRSSARVYRLSTDGDTDGAISIIRDLMAGATPENREEMRKLIAYLIANREGLIDYRDRDGDVDPGARGLGAIEGNIDKVEANRFKKRGMRWSTDGAGALAKVIELNYNQGLKDRIGKRRGRSPGDVPVEILTVAEAVRTNLRKNPDKWLEARLPALYGPHSDRPWVKILKGVSQLQEAV